jgi:hypothetical protein
MKKKYESMTRHIPILEDHGHLYMYYGLPYSKECRVYGDQNEDGHLVVSYECEDLLDSIAAAFEEDCKWLDILEEHRIKLDDVFDVDVESQDLDVIAALLIYMVVSVTYEDKLIDAVNNGFMIRLLKRLDHWN